MIKGHTKIELTNIKTGEKKVVEDDNLVTNALKYLMNPPMNVTNNKIPLGVTNDYNNSNLKGNHIDKYFGGILLFNEAIEENIDNVLIPFTNKMIGNAIVNYASASGVPEFGAYNSEESTLTFENGKATRKYVYDFSTSKANGTISCVALTNIIAGYVGAGNRSSNFEAVDTGIINFKKTSSYDSGWWEQFWYNYNHNYNYTNWIIDKPDNNNNDFMLIANYNEYYLIADLYNLIYTPSYKNNHITSTGKLKLYTVTNQMYKYNPFNEFCVKYSVSPYTYNIVAKSIEIDVPSELKTYNSNLCFGNTCISNDTNGIWIVVWENGVGARCWYISKDLKENKLITVKNTTGTNLALPQENSSYYYNNMLIFENYFLCISSDFKHVYAININDNTDTFEFSYNTIPNPMYYTFYIIGTQLFIALNAKTLGVCDMKHKCINVLNGEMQFNINNSNVNLYQNCVSSPFDSNSKCIVNIKPKGRTNVASIGCNPFLLSTINNLPEPVTKTSDMTMKITYTLTSDLEDGGE